MLSLNATTIHNHQVFYVLLFLLGFTLADMIFHKFLELHSTLSEKKIFVTSFPFLTDSLKPSKSAKCDKCFLLMLP